MGQWDNIERFDAIPLALGLLRGWNNKVPGMQDKPELSDQVIEKIKRNFPAANIECIVLREPATVQRGRWPRRLVPETRFISLSDFRTWRYTELGQEIIRYAPHLF